jgi:hypothetical protein
MPTANDMIVHSLSVSQKMLHRYVEDLKPEEYLHRPTPKANCTAWLLGHLILVDKGLVEGLGVKDAPSLPDGFEKKFSQKDGAPEAAEFGDVTILMPLFDKYRTLLIGKVAALPAAELEKPSPRQHPMFSNVAERLNYMGHHATMHIGQITIIRRSLGRPPIV